MKMEIVEKRACSVVVVFARNEGLSALVSDGQLFENNNKIETNRHKYVE
jgi:hypothetical protein